MAKRVKKDKDEKTEKELAAMERETIIRISDYDKEWDVISASPKYLDKFAKLGWKSTPVENVPWAYHKFTVPARCIKFGRWEKKKMTQAHIDAIQKARWGSKSNTIELNPAVDIANAGDGKGDE